MSEVTLDFMSWFPPAAHRCGPEHRARMADAQRGHPVRWPRLHGLRRLGCQGGSCVRPLLAACARACVCACACVACLCVCMDACVFHPWLCFTICLRSQEDMLGQSSKALHPCMCGTLSLLP